MRGADRESDRQAKQDAVLRALRDGVSVEEGRLRNSRDRWAYADTKLSQARCGTLAPIQHEGAEQPLQWWQRD